MAAPLSSFVGSIGFEWLASLRLGDAREAEAILADVTQKRRHGRRSVIIDSEVWYRRDGHPIATAEATLVRIADPEDDGSGDPVADADVPRYDDGTPTDLAAAYDR